MSNTNIQKQLIILAMLYLTADVASNLVVYKLVPVLGTSWLLPGSVFIFPWTYFFADIIAEIYGYKMARLIVWTDLVCNLIFCTAILSVIHLSSPHHLDKNQQIYNTVFDPLLRVNFGSLLGIVLGSFTNIYILSKLKIITHGRFFCLRSILSSIIGEIVLLIVSGFFVFIGYIDISSIIKLIIADYIFKLLFAIIMSIPADLIQKYLKRINNVSIYDDGVNFNPFSLDTKYSDKQYIIERR